MLLATRQPPSPTGGVDRRGTLRYSCDSFALAAPWTRSLDHDGALIATPGV
jgi:hypothetical protein